jgi:hypothetical protein
MTSRPRTFDARSFASIARALLAAGALCLVTSAPAQEVRPPGEIPTPAPGRARRQSAGGTGAGFRFPAGLRRYDRPLAQRGHDQIQVGFAGRAGDIRSTRQGDPRRAKDATDAVVGLPNARIVIARERCAVAQNGAPDCQAAAAAACRGKGFQTGKSLDTQSEHKCPVQVLLKGRAPNDAECPTEIFVTRAVCQ